MKQDTCALEILKILKIGKHDRYSITWRERGSGVVVRDEVFEIDISHATETFVDHAWDLRHHPVLHVELPKCVKQRNNIEMSYRAVLLIFKVLFKLCGALVNSES